MENRYIKCQGKIKEKSGNMRWMISGNPIQIVAMKIEVDLTNAYIFCSAELKYPSPGELA